MWQTDWDEKPREIGDIEKPRVSTLSPHDIGSSYCLYWVEHCIECALPDCFKVCPLYVARRDQKCARFKSGISPNWQYPGLFDYGAEIEFRRWGKLEANFGFGAMKPEQARSIDRIDRGVLRFLRPISSLFSAISPKLRFNGAYAVSRELLLQRFTRRRKDSFDEFVIEVWNLQSHSLRLVIECWQQGMKFRTSIQLEAGRTLQRIPAASMGIDLYGAFGMIRVYPENDAEAHLVFSWLDFVQYSRSSEQNALVPDDERSVQRANKVKCVIWDLDQTAWDGILGEQDSNAILLRPDVLRAMLALDERGILQSVASKNDHDNTWHVLERLGVAQLFLYPQINWEPKSISIQRIVASLNIGIDSCAFIDDSPFERAEVSHELPEIRVFTEADVPELLDRPEFDVLVTPESKQRRAFYASESQRKEKALEYGDRYETFLKTCQMEAVLFKPTEVEQVERCLELLHRSNQLNLSTHRYAREEFKQLLEQPNVLSVCTTCRDRFGDYGIVGFASVVTSREGAFLKDFVLSCRVAQKKVENAWFKFLARAALSSGYSKIYAPYVKTSRNGVLLNALLEVGFVETRKDDSGSFLELNCLANPPASEIVSIVAGAIRLQPASISSILSEPLENVDETRQAAS